MPQTVTINIRVDEKVKKDAEVLFNNLGLNISTAVNIFFRQAIMDEALPFKPQLKYKHITLKDRLRDFNGNYEFIEWDTGAAVGNEVVK